jgi:hypothetical protein
MRKSAIFQCTIRSSVKEAVVTFSNYHFYVEAISQRDQAIFIIATLVLLVCEILFLVRAWRPGWLRAATWIIIGGFYATLAAMVIFVRAGAAAVGAGG